MGQDYWDGALWVFQGTVLTDGSNSGTASLRVDPGVGNEFEVLYGHIRHSDASSRSVQVIVRDASDNEVAFLLNTSGTANVFGFPQSGSGAGIGSAGGSRYIVAGTMDLFLSVGSMSVSDTATFGVVCRIRGGVPTAALAGPTGSTDTINTDRVF